MSARTIETAVATAGGSLDIPLLAAPDHVNAYTVGEAAIEHTFSASAAGFRVTVIDGGIDVFYGPAADFDADSAETVPSIGDMARGLGADRTISLRRRGAVDATIKLVEY